MELVDALSALGVARDDTPARELCDVLTQAPGTASVARDWCVLAAALARALTPGVPAAAHAPGVARGLKTWDQAPPPLVLGIAGGQGSGKTTLARQLRQALTIAGARAAACSLDDFYLTRPQRRSLARTVHPLLATRGVPGTHDVALLQRVITALAKPGVVRLPAFDKGADDRLPTERWEPVTGPVDVLVLEGWCLGAWAQAEPALLEPVNDLEAEADPDGVWRRYVNEALRGPYAALWNRLDALIYLQVPDMAAVERWRSEQEQELPPARRMTGVQLRRFIDHYERITIAMLADLPGRADLVVRLNGDHEVTGVHRNILRAP